MSKNVLFCNVEQFILNELEMGHLTDVLHVPVISTYFWVFEWHGNGQQEQWQKQCFGHWVYKLLDINYESFIHSFIRVNQKRIKITILLANNLKIHDCFNSSICYFSFYSLFYLSYYNYYSLIILSSWWWLNSMFYSWSICYCYWSDGFYY